MTDTSLWMEKKNQLENILKSQSFNANEKLTDEEIDTLSHAVVDIEEACQKFLDLLNSIYTQKRTFDLDMLEDMQFELQHILYHINDSTYFDNVLTPYKSEE